MGAQVDAAVLAGGPLGVPLRAGSGASTVDLGPLPPGYDLARVALSHSHVAFAPSGYDPATLSYSRVLRLPVRGPVGVVVRQVGDALPVRVLDPAPLDEPDRHALREQMRHVLAADDDVAGLRRAAAACADVLPGVDLAVRRGGGRLLRSPTAWEDLVGVLLSTGWSWAAARAAVGRLVRQYADEGAPGAWCFPSPRAVAAVGEERLAAETGVGRRAGPLLALARAVDAGRVDPQAWLARPHGGDREGGARQGGGPEDGEPGHGEPRDGGLGDGEVREALLRLAGFGTWSADVALGLLGRPRGLALDAWAVGKLARVLDRPGLTAREVAERYAPLGRWAGTGCWLELTADWYGPAGTRSPGEAA